MIKYLLILIPYLLALFVIATLLKNNIKLSLEIQEREEKIEKLSNRIDSLKQELKEKESLITIDQNYEGVPI